MCRKCECEICLLPFDEDLHRPKVLPCGHTLCSACARQTISSCPFDRREFSSLTFKSLPDNYFVMQLMAWEQLRCTQHPGSAARFFCLSHLLPLCSACSQTHACTLEDLLTFDVSCFLFRELGGDLTISHLDNSEKLAMLQQRKNIPAQIVKALKQRPELSLDRFQRVLPRKRWSDTYAWRLDISGRQVEAFSFRVDHRVQLSGISVGTLIDSNTLGKVRFVRLCRGDRTSEEALTLSKEVPLTSQKTRMKIAFSQGAEIEPNVWYTLLVKMIGGRVFTGHPDTVRTQGIDQSNWELKEPEATAGWLTTGANSKGGPILQLYYYRI